MGRAVRAADNERMIRTAESGGVLPVSPTYETRLFIDGEFREANGKRTWKLINPATEEEICEIREASEKDVEAAVQAAHKAFASWSLNIGARRRGELLMKLANLLQEEKENIAHIECINVGKPIQYARGDMDACIANLKYYSGWADKITGGSYIPVLESEKISCHTRREPVGVVAAIVPWNFPLMLTVMKAAAALACGCTVVVKTSEKSPLSALALCKLVQKAGFPAGVFNVLNGFGESVGAHLIRQPLVQKVSFTGSSSVGCLVAQECAATVKRVTLELGGKSPLIILKDADIQKAAEATWKGLFHNSGQCCVACSRILVQCDVYNEFVEKLKETVSKKAKLSNPLETCCTQGPIVDSKQLARVISYIEEGKKEGAKCVLGGVKKEGKFNAQTIRSMGSEPASSPPAFLLQITSLHAGTVWVNTYLSGDVGIPFGGYKASGYGREGGEEGLLPYLETKTVVMSIEL
ncbi:aldehyde dehydrogenase, putative [Eimeria acervulina]|uniref:Aldehyde dehydrogenase, putative n=1 Tax=Eimeria acervulina TaxID=5801 RepID=U6GEM7_EIMAC|nr:aldehyde dehydrogenase, putative [Eimeria acervulina]CDI78711.1 aldehyde dehydrogenase, putative [Eimeria acervulina]